jgi:hypothetical protein
VAARDGWRYDERVQFRENGYIPAEQFAVTGAATAPDPGGMRRDTGRDDAVHRA